MNKNAEKDLEHIRNMMERSSRFISLSGLSGVFAGIFALIAAFIAYWIFKNDGVDYFSDPEIHYSNSTLGKLILLCILTLLAAIASGIFFTFKKSKKSGVQAWSNVARRLLVNFITPLVAGGIFSLALYYHFQFGLIAPVMLIFYGLALINASKFTYTDINYLGYAELILGLVSLFFIGYGLLFWAVGFGLLHIIYGLIMYKKYR